MGLRGKLRRVKVIGKDSIQKADTIQKVPAPRGRKSDGLKVVWLGRGTGGDGTGGMTRGLRRGERVVVMVGQGSPRGPRQMDTVSRVVMRPAEGVLLAEVHPRE